MAAMLALLIVGGSSAAAAGVSGAAASTGTCDQKKTQAAHRVKNKAVVGASRSSSCSGEGGSSSSSVEQRWAAYCDLFGGWSPGSSVNLIRGEELGAGRPVSVGDATQPVEGVSSATRSFRWSVQCTTAAGGFFEYSIVLAAGEAPVDPVTVRNAALARLEIPGPELGGSPPLDDPDRFSVVRIPTWLWITHPWEAVTASASDGGVSVSVTATPKKVTWDPGDGEPTFECLDAGTPWRKGMDESDATCSHTYSQSSAGEVDDAYRLTASVSWSLTWTINGVDQGQFDVYQPSLTIDHQVGEIQAVAAPRNG